MNVAKLDCLVKSDSTIEKLSSTLVHTSMQPKSTLVHLAAYHGNNLALFTLVEAGASPSAKDIAGNTALHVAVSQHKDDSVRLLLSIHSHNEGNDEGSTPLHLAVTHGRTGAVREMLLKGAQRSHVDN